MNTNIKNILYFIYKKKDSLKLKCFIFLNNEKIRFVINDKIVYHMNLVYKYFFYFF